MLLFRPGLGETVSVNPNLVAQAQATAANHPSTVSTGDTAPFFSIQQHTWNDVYHEQGRGWSAEELAAAQALTKATLATINAQLPPCPTGSYTDSSRTCYYGYSPIAWSRMEHAPRGLLAPGTFDMFGVVFGVDEFAKDGKAQRTYQPTPDQRAWIELALIDKATRKFFGHHAAERYPWLGRYTLGEMDAEIAQSYKKRVNSPFIPSSVIQKWADNASVDQMLALVPDMALYLINFERNPIQPTSTERTQPGGWKSWITRGGYPLSTSVAHAMTPLSDREAVSFPASIACACGPNGLPSALPGYLGTDGPKHTGDPDAIVKTFISIPQTPGAAWTLTVDPYDDRSWITKVGEYGAKILTFFGKLFCDATVQTVVQQNFAKTTAEVCIDAKGAACQKGSQGCRCTQPPVYDQASVKASNVVMGWLCSSFQKENAPQVPLPPPDPWPPAPAAGGIPWWLVGVGVVAGAIIAANR